MDADLLRILLAALGALVLGGLYLWERRRQGGDEDRDDADSPDLEEDGTSGKREPRLGPWHVSPEPDGEGQGASPAARQAAGGEQPELVLEPPPSPSKEPEPAIPPGPMLLTLHVVARDEPFDGSDIVHSAGHCGLEPGEMEIFHCLLGEEDRRQILFSMANMVKPGTFPFGAMAEFQSPGLTLFAELQGTVDDPGRMEELLGTAHTLVDELGGELRDAQRQPFTPEAEQRLRERVMRFVETRLSEHPQ
jgi:cell division protein ZipA